jgi:hypothetical protein
MTYGPYTICRQRLDNIPAMAGATLTACPYCGCHCWKTDLETDPLPPNTTAACTACALKRGSHQREMDEAREKKEGP